MSSAQDITLTAQEQDLITRLKSFRVPEMAHILEEQLKDPVSYTHLIPAIRTGTAIHADTVAGSAYFLYPSRKRMWIR